jgi:DNA-binding XRE family transcriptional regulator
MKPEKGARLEASGWRVGSTEELLGLTPEEVALLELRLKLSDAVKRLRQQAGLTQAQMAKRLGSSQSRVAKIEAGDGSVSLDLLIRSFFTLGGTAHDLAEVVEEPVQAIAS